MLCGLSYGKGRKPRVSRAKLSLNTRCSDAATFSIRNAVYPLLPRLAAMKRIILAYTGSSARDADLLPTRPTHRSAPSTRSSPTKPAAVLAFDLFGKAGRKQAWPSAPAARTHRAPTASRCARLQSQRCAGKSTARAAAAYIYSCIEGAAPQSSTGNDGLQLVEGRRFRGAHAGGTTLLFIRGHFKEVVPEAAEKPSTTFIRGQPKPTSWLVGNGSPTQAPVTRRRSWDALPPKAAQPDTPVRVAKLTTELDALSARLPARPAAHKPAPARAAVPCK